MSEIATFKEYIEEGFKDVITDFTNGGECSRCGNCCNNLLPMNKQEIERIRKYVKANSVCEVQHVTPLARAPLDMTCPFKSKDSCSIYEVRPKVCRSFLCSKPEEAKRNRAKFASIMRMIDLRKEFF